MKALKAIWTVLKAIGGFIVGATGVFGWLNITPEMVGQTTYDVMRLMWPIVMFAGGALAGWGITKIWSDRKMSKKDAEIAELEKRPTKDDVDDLVHAHAEEIAAKDAVIAKLETDMERRVDEGIKEHMECFMDILYKKVRAARDPDSVIRDRIESRELDGHSVRILNIVLETGIYERRWLRDALNDGFVVVREDDLSLHDDGWYFRDLVDDGVACTDGYGAPSRRFRIKQDVADVLSANPEVFAIVEREDEAMSDLVRRQNDRAARGRMRESRGTGES